MKTNYIKATMSIAVVVLAVCACVTQAAPATVVRESMKGEIVFLAKILGPLRQLPNKLEDIEAIIERAATDKDFVMEVAKRQGGAWDMDYGWGGGRFGKRDSDKRYDSFGLGGRFGRSVDHVEGEKNNH